MVERMDVEPNPKKAPFTPTLKIPPPRAFRLYKTFGFTIRQKHGTADLSKKIHYNTQEVVTTKPTQVIYLEGEVYEVWADR